MIKKRHKRDDHDEKTCFRCRLHELFDELRKDNDIRFILLAMGEACGSILAQLDNEESKYEFMAMVARSYHEEQEDKSETRH
jgi:hypothetical protein